MITMRLYKRYFCYGVVFTSVIWALIIILYLHIQEKSSDIRSGRLFRIGPRHDELVRHGISFNQRVGDLDPGDDDDQLLPDANANLAIIRTPEDQKKRDEGNRLYAFNQLISDRIGFHRDIPDTRHKLCRNKSYPPNLGKVSVIICFYNEAWSTLLRTVYSVIDRSPDNLIHEILLLDDNSELDHLGAKLEDHVKENIPKAHVVRTSQREGLIRARNLGAEKATGEVIVFLDSHCEVNMGWLEPLLAQISKDRHNVAIPIIDIINHDSFQYEASPLVRGGFNWGLHFRWDQIPSHLLKDKNDIAEPIQSPTMAGGLFAVDRQFFLDLGKYDDGMDIWGGENLEISFRVWQCGGRLDIIPCSRVGHVFRKRRPYGSPHGEDTMTKNSLRVAHVWMDEYKEYYFKVRPDARDKPYGVIQGRQELREALKCKSFKWYLQNVYPEQTLPDEKGQGGWASNMKPNPRRKPNIIRQGTLKHTKTGLCVESRQGVFEKKSMLTLARCSASKAQMWFETDKHEMTLSNVLCMDGENVPGGRSFPRLMKCHESGGSQEWIWTGKERHLLLNPASGHCLGVDRAQEGATISLDICEETIVNLHFHLKLV